METVVAPRHPNESTAPATAIRSTMLQSSFKAIESLGRLDDYFLALPIEYHATLEQLVVGQWLDLSVGLAHYGAIESLRLSNEQAFANGRIVSDKVQKSWVVTVFRSLGTGITPWSALSRLPTAWDRLVLGGSTAVYKLGPKDAQVEMLGCSLARFDYVRYGWAGMMTGTLELVTPRVRSALVHAKCTQTRAVYHVSWV